MQVGKWIVMPALKGKEYDLSQAQLLGGGVNDDSDNDDSDSDYDDEGRIEVTNGSEVFLQQDLFHLAREKQRSKVGEVKMVKTEGVSLGRVDLFLVSLQEDRCLTRPLSTRQDHEDVNKGTKAILTQTPHDQKRAVRALPLPLRNHQSINQLTEQTPHAQQTGPQVPSRTPRRVAHPPRRGQAQDQREG